MYIFSLGGPKNYAYKVKCGKDGSEKYEIKVKGFKIDSQVNQKLNFENMAGIVPAFARSKKSEKVTLVLKTFQRTTDRKVLTKFQKKNYQAVYDKRVLFPDCTTLPYGY